MTIVVDWDVKPQIIQPTLPGRKSPKTIFLVFFCDTSHFCDMSHMYLSDDTTKRVFGSFDQARNKPACAAPEAS